MENDPDRPDSPRLAIYNGIVADRTDPLKIGRVKVMIPGVAEPSTGWAFPLSIGSGENQRGWFDVPEVGAEVAVWFLQGDSDHPYYVCAHWGAPGGSGQAPTPIQAADVTPETAPDIKVYETPRHLLVFDCRSGREGFEVKDKVSGDGVTYDGLTRILELRGTVAVRIVSDGAVTIDGLAVTINNRPVLPGGPIR